MSKRTLSVCRKGMTLLALWVCLLSMTLQPALVLRAQTVDPADATTVENADAATPRHFFLPLAANVATSNTADTLLLQAEPQAQSLPPVEPLPAATHVHDDSHAHDDYALAEAARQRNEPPFVAPANAAATGPLNVVGRWDPPVTWPFVMATAANLPDGRIIAWGGNNARSFSGGASTFAAIWDPATNQFLSRNHTDHSMFCAIPTMLADGRVFVNGGDGTRERTSIFDYRTNAWTRVQNMSVGRWYNGAVALPNGKVFTMLGDPGGPYPEVWTPNQGWSLLTGANLNNGILNFTGYQSTWLPYLHLAPNGLLFHAGPTTQMNWLNPNGNGSITNAGLTNTWYPKYASAVMYDAGKILVAGGAANSTNTAPGANQAMVIDLNGANPTKTVIAPMNYARKFNNAVMLPTGEVLIVGGNTSGIEFSDSGTILTPEIWNPDTQTWRQVADHSVPRNYHSVALLMTDGRVWSGGGGLCNCAADHPDHQIYWPPYLFNADGSVATRPVIAAAPNTITYGDTFTVQATAGIARFSLVKLSGITHNLNSDLRYLKVPFTALDGDQYQLTVASNANVLTPGYWMLFAVNSQGTPSVAKVLQVTTTPVQPPPVGTVRYVKLEALAEVAGNPWTSVAEFNVLDENGNPINRTGWVISADSQEMQGENGVASNVADGNTTTIWHTQWQAASPTHPHWLVIDLAGNYAVSGFRYLPRQDGANGRIANYKFYISADGVNWGAPVTQGTFPNSTAEQSVSFALDINPVTATPQPVNTTIDYTASAANGINPRFKWLFGDGTPETAYSTSPTMDHVFSRPGIYTVKVTVTDDRGVERSTTFTQAIHLPLTANRPVVSMNIVYENRSGANGRVWVVNQDNDTVSIFDAITNSKVAEIAVGRAPRSLAVAPNGRIWVTNKGTSTISLIDPSTLAVVQTISLPYGSQPFGIAFAPTGNVGYVTLEGAGKLLRFDATTATQTGSVDVGPHVRHLSINSDGSKIYVARFITPRIPGEATATPQVANGGGEIVVVNADLSINKTITLRVSDKPDTEVQGRGIPNYLGPLVISPDGINGWTPSKQDNIQRGVLRDGNNLNFQNTLRAIASRVDLSSDTEDYPARIDHDNAGVASTALFDKSGNYLFVALETNREIAVVDGYLQRDLFRIPVGRAPQGLALSPDGLRLYVNNFMDRSVTVLDISKLINEGQSTIPTVATYNAVATEKLAATVLLGKQFFYDAKDTRLALDSYISCAGCHNDGGQDGRIWDITGFGEGLRNTISLNGHAGTGQGFLHWSGNFDEVQDFEAQIRNLAGGTGLMTNAQFNTGTRSQPLGDPKAGVSADLDALAAYVTSLNSFTASPYRNSDGTLTAAAQAGKTIFQNQNCAQCHSGVAFSDSSNIIFRNIGTIKPTSGNRLGVPLAGIDTPTLRDTWATAPYLHDGSATTLSDAVRAHNNVVINDSDLAQLVAYLTQIDAAETTAPSVLGSGQLLREWWSNLSGTAVTNLTTNAAYPYSPSGSNLLTRFEAPTNWADNYGARIRGYLHAPITGQYRFWIAGDDNSQLLLSTSANPANAVVIASVPGWSNPREWGKYTQQQSALITLQAGQKYYMEALQKEGGGGDNLAVAWQIPGGVQAVIDGQYLSPWVVQPVSNLARGKSATQSSTYGGANASRAVDGNTNGTFSAGSVTHTNYNTNAWWQVNLGATYQLDSIQLWNRTDCCANRLSNFYVFVSTTDMTGRSLTSLVNDATIWRFQVTGQAPTKLHVPAAVNGRFVRVQLAGTNNLSLAEVQVYGR
ncbi:MAG: DUF1929 domain-containing protein [Caldilinea sp. CFX5]|nr:DUF1929 domain-containing protein [Caldilinea sp. CFX5]